MGGLLHATWIGGPQSQEPRSSTLPNLGVHALNEEIETETGEENRSRDDGAGNNTLVMPGQVGLQRGHYQPDLHQKKNDDERHGRVDRREALFLSQRWRLSHTNLPTGFR